MPTIDLTDDELAALTAAVRRVINEDRFPHAPRLEPLRAALAKLDPCGTEAGARTAAATRGASTKPRGPASAALI